LDLFVVECYLQWLFLILNISIGGIISMSQTGPKDWRELCRKASEELDPDKLMDLIVEINKALDEQSKRRKGIFEGINNADPEKDSRESEATFPKLRNGWRNVRLQFGSLHPCVITALP
jgi:hypothetical protein